MITAAGLIGANATAAVIGGGLSAYGADKAAKAQRDAQKMQIAWERERANNAHQWEVNDLMKAGINPTLTAGGQGAATGSIGGVQDVYSGAYSTAGQLMANVVNDVISNSKQIREIEDIKDTIKTRGTQRKLIQAQEGLAKETASKVKQETAIAEYTKEKLKIFSPKTREILEGIRDGTNTAANMINSIVGLKGFFIKHGARANEAEEAAYLVKTWRKTTK